MTAPVVDKEVFKAWGYAKAASIVTDAVKTAMVHICGPGVLFAKPEGADLVCGYMDETRKRVPNGYVLLVEAVKAYMEGLTRGIEEHLERMRERASAAYEERVEEQLREAA